ncbi:hypothetical protein NQ317_001526 [Molorchus minor]|uniref:Uncharacterized protein n=1 Tax=Molorchus minor TaxID=1323400 RepID=A0ABQ9J8E5_9CUCU|nr:hypothetical protein NQ317_001526 [Molorchus minor]
MKSDVAVFAGFDYNGQRRMNEITEYDIRKFPWQFHLPSIGLFAECFQPLAIIRNKLSNILRQYLEILDLSFSTTLGIELPECQEKPHKIENHSLLDIILCNFSLFNQLCISYSLLYTCNNIINPWAKLKTDSWPHLAGEPLVCQPLEYYIKKRLALNVPHANTRPSSKSAAECESPADICTAFPGNSTSPASNSASSFPSVTLPRAPSSLQPNGMYCLEKLRAPMNTGVRDRITK